MKNLIVKFGMVAVALLMSFSIVIGATPLNSFKGTFKNTDANTRGLTTMKIYVSGSSVKINAFGSCSPKDCDWGKVSAVAYSSKVTEKVTTNTSGIIGHYKTSFSKTEVIIRPRGKNLISVQTYTRFTDGSGRSPYMGSYTMKKSATTAATKLPAPRLISPANNKSFNHFPRKTTLKWGAVQGARKYIIQIDCFHCCKSGKWCGDVGKMFKTGTATTTSYTFNWVGANKGKWRVIAVDKNGKKGRASAWRNFNYTK